MVIIDKDEIECLFKSRSILPTRLLNAENKRVGSGLIHIELGGSQCRTADFAFVEMRFLGNSISQEIVFG